MTFKNLVKTWSFPDRTNERIQLTLRLDFDSYAKFHALKEIFPTRSVNEMINDILKSGLSEVIDSLPLHTITQEDIEFDRMVGNDSGTRVGDIVGLRVSFDYAYRNILQSKSVNDAEVTTNA